MAKKRKDAQKKMMLEACERLTLTLTLTPTLTGGT